MYKTNFAIMEPKDIFSYTIVLDKWINQKKNQLDNLKNVSDKFELDLKSKLLNDSQYKSTHEIYKQMLEEKKNLYTEIEELKIEFQSAIVFSSALHAVDMNHFEQQFDQKFGSEG